MTDAYRDGPGAERDVSPMTSPETGTGKGVSAILNRLGKALIATAATASVIGLAAAPAFARATTWTVTPGGSVTAKAGKTTINDTTAGQSLTCTSSTAKGTLKSGSGLPGAGIGTFASLSFSGCTIAGFSLSATLTGTMPLNAVKFHPASNTASMTITGIHGTINVSSLSCGATVDGTSATAHNGTVTAKFNNVTHKLKVLTAGSNLHLYKNTCPVINNGDSVNFTANYKTIPAQTITSP
jgi:hypothetical protein